MECLLFGVGVESWVERNDQLIWKKKNVLLHLLQCRWRGISACVIRPYSIGNWSRKGEM